MDFLAGLGAGVASVVIGQPLDTLRVHEQAAATTAAKTSSAAAKTSSGPLATARRLLSSPSGGGGGGGPRAFWRGVAYPAATIGIQSAIVFQAYGIGCRFLAEREEGERASSSASCPLPPPPSSSAASASPSSSPSSSAAASPLSYSSVFLAGTVAGAAQLAVIVPVDLLKIRAQLSCPSTKKKSEAAAALASAARSTKFSFLLSNPLALAVSSAWRDGGGSVRGLYRGGLVTAFRDVPSHGVYFACYELCRELFDRGSRSRRSGGGGSGGGGEGESASPSSSSLALLAAGGIAGAASWLSIYPLDVIKTRVQAATLLGSSGSGSSSGTLAATATAAAPFPPPLPSAATALRDAIRAGGLWNGLSSTLVSFLVRGKEKEGEERKRKQTPLSFWDLDFPRRKKILNKKT